MYEKAMSLINKIPQDKQLHFFWSSWGTIALARAGAVVGMPAWLAVLIVLGFGLWREVVTFDKRRIKDHSLDMAANLLGCLAGLLPC